MCLITYAPEGPADLDWKTLDYSASHGNNDGFGLAWYNRDTGEWNVSKSMRTHRLRGAVKRVPHKAPLVIHQRWATHGARVIDNCHPYQLGTSKAVLFHNGVINGTRASSYSRWSATGKKALTVCDISDTRAYIEDELAPIVDEFGPSILAFNSMIEVMGNRVGSSVLAICVPDMEVPIFVNEDMGDWEKKGRLYYSNRYSRPSSYIPSPYYSNSGGNNDWEDDDRYYYGGYGKKAAETKTEVVKEPASKGGSVVPYTPRNVGKEIDESLDNKNMMLMYGSEYGNEEGASVTVILDPDVQEWDAYVEEENRRYSAEKAARFKD